MTPQAALQRVIEHREIFHDEMVALMQQIMSGQVTWTKPDFADRRHLGKSPAAAFPSFGRRLLWIRK